MRIVLNTSSDTAGAQAGILGLAQRLTAAGVDAALGERSYADADVAIFHSYDHEMEAARAANPSLRVGLVDPKQSSRSAIEAARAADFLLVSSVEQREAFLRLNRNVFVLYMFPVVPARERRHSAPAADAPLVVGYHGNRVHLEAMAETVKPALEELGRRRPVELRAIYNIASSGQAAAGMPDPAFVSVRHVQLDPKLAEGATVSRTLLDELATADIGIVPNLLPVDGRERTLERTARGDGWLAYEPFDHLWRMKASSNPGRLYLFARLGIPVVADPTPSAAQFVLDGISGFLAASAAGWYEALEALADSAERRTQMAAELRRRLDAAYDRQIPDLLAFLERAPLGPPLAALSPRSAEDDLARLPAYARPSPRPGRERLRARLWSLLHR